MVSSAPSVNSRANWSMGRHLISEGEATIGDAICRPLVSDGGGGEFLSTGDNSLQAPADCDRGNLSLVVPSVSDEGK